MKTTNVIGLKKPEANDFYNVEDVNYNSDTLDALFEKDANGTVVAKNAKTLDGHGAEYFLSVDGYKPNSYRGNTTEEIDQLLNDLHTNIVENNKVYTAKIDFGQPHPIFGGSARFIIGHKVTNTYGWQLAISYSKTNAQKILFRQLVNSDTWSEWDSNAFASDLANYLPKTGGEVSANSAFPIGVKNTGSESCYTKYSGASGLLGYLGIRTGGEAAHMTKDGAVYNLLHTGNKPSGTYTGKGEWQSIHTGGIGDCAIVWRDDGFFSIITYGGVINGGNDGVVSTSTAANCKDGKISMATNDKHFNELGVQYSYRLL